MAIELSLIFFAIIILVCIGLNGMSNKLGTPVLLAFIVLGMLASLWKQFSFVDMKLVEQFSTIALIFIMFYGGFGTRWESAKPVLKESVLLATLGVVMTAGLTGLFCHFVLGWKWIESFLMGSVVSSTDAASVFGILRSRKLGLRHHTAPILEVESGSNDPLSYMLTVIFISIYQGSATGGAIGYLVFAQIVYGLLCGLVLSTLVVLLYKKLRQLPSGFDSMLNVSIALLAYAIPALIKGNGFLCTYIVGMVMGNFVKINSQTKKAQIHFFDGVTTLMQIYLFFLLGLVAGPSVMGGASVKEILLPALFIALFMLLISRTATIFFFLGFFKKYKKWIKQKALISFVGLRGAASIVFAIMATASLGNTMEHNILGIVFLIVLLSIAVQGTLLPAVAKRLDMIDENEDVSKTFSDYSELYDAQFGEFELTEKSPWAGKTIKEIGTPKSMLFALVFRNGECITPRGHTVLQAGDKIVVSTKKSENSGNLSEDVIRPSSEFVGKTLDEWSKENEGLVILLRRNDETIIPKGNEKLHANDTIVVMNED